MKNKLFTAIALLAILCAGAQAATIFQEDFEGYNDGDSIADGGPWAGWVYGVVTYTSNNVYNGEWFDGADPVTATAQTGQTGVAQGDVCLKTYGDTGYAPNYADNKFVETIIYREHVLTAADISLGEATFDFDFKAWPMADGGITNTISTANVFLKTLDVSAFYNTDGLDEQAVTSADTAWGSGALSIDISGLADGDILQWGTSMTSQNYSSTAIATDNFDVQVIPEPATIGLFGLGALSAWIIRRNKIKQREEA